MSRPRRRGVRSGAVAHAARAPLSYCARAINGFAHAVRVLARATALLLAAHPSAAAAFVGLTALIGLLPVAQVWLAKVVLDQIGSGAQADALVSASLYALVLVAAAGLTPLMTAAADILRDHAFGDVDRRLIDAGGKLADLGRVERPAFQQELRLVSAVVWQWPILIWLVQTGIGTGLTLCGVLLLLARLHPLLPVALAALTIPSMVISERAHRLRTAAMVRQSQAGREMDYCLQVATEPAAAKEVRIFGLGGFFLERFRGWSRAALRDAAALRTYEMRLSCGFAALQAVGLAGGFWYVAAQVGAGRMTIGEVALYVAGVAQAESRLSMFSRLFWQMRQALVHLPALFAFLETAAPAIALAPAGRALPAPGALRSGIELRRVAFRYPESTGAVLADVNGFLPGGQVTALVGANGAGKSTLVKLFTRMYDPTGGEILLDGHPLWEYDLESLRRCITVAYQDFARFSLTLGENIAVGCVAVRDAQDAVEDGLIAAVEAAARRAGADEVAARLPQGYDTPLTRRFAGGVELSGGEWQKVATARAFVRDAALVILDEPTASLDAEAEYRLFQHFRELVAGKTALLISHRFSTVRMADRILVLDGGRVMEAGTHEELIAHGGRYATLYEMQAGQYR